MLRAALVLWVLAMISLVFAFGGFAGEVSAGIAKVLFWFFLVTDLVFFLLMLITGANPPEEGDAL